MVELQEAVGLNKSEDERKGDLQSALSGSHHGRSQASGMSVRSQSQKPKLSENNLLEMDSGSKSKGSSSSSSSSSSPEVAKSSPEVASDSKKPETEEISQSKVTTKPNITITPDVGAEEAENLNRTRQPSVHKAFADENDG